MDDGGGVKKRVAFEGQHEPDVIISEKQKRGSASSSSSSSSFSSRSSSSGSLDDDLITIEDEFLTKTPSRSKQPPESSDLTPPCQPDHKMQGGQLTGHDSSRIPSAIFSSRPSTAGDWSVASNESLFSLHMGGNQSFSKDQAFLMYRSGELARLDHDCPSTQYSGLPSVTEVEEPKRSGADHLLPKDDGVTESGSKPLSPIQSDDDALGNKSEECRNSASNAVSPHSECSIHSNQSFAFPVFSDDLGRNKTVRLEQNGQKSPKKRQQQGEKEELHLQHAQSPRKPQKASSFGRRSWLPRCSCFSLPCK